MHSANQDKLDLAPRGGRKAICCRRVKRSNAKHQSLPLHSCAALSLRSEDSFSRRSCVADCIDYLFVAAGNAAFNWIRETYRRQD